MRTDDWMKLLGIDDDGALLVRPDQHVAWRSQHFVTDTTAALSRALAKILSDDKLNLGVGQNS